MLGQTVSGTEAVLSGRWETNAGWFYAAIQQNDMSVGDLDGDGVLELIVKWYPSNAKDNSGSGYTGQDFPGWI